MSAATAREVSIKSAISKLNAKAKVADALEDYGFLELPISLAHADAVRALPGLHRDPFDRMLVAQARLEGLTLVSSDAVFRGYGVPVIWD